MYFNLEYLSSIQSENHTINLNVTYGIYESDSLDFYRLCKNHNFAPEKHITEIDQLGAPIEIETKHYVNNQNFIFECSET